MDDVRQAQRLQFTPFRAPASVWLIMLGSALFCVSAWYLFHRYINERGEERFHAQVVSLARSIDSRMLVYEQVLRSGIGLFMSSHEVSRDEWRIYVQNARLQQYYPGIQGLGYSVILTKDQLANFIASVRAEGFPDFKVYPEGDRPIYHSILYLEPFDWRNQRAFGYDMYSEARRKEAIDRAILTGNSAVSAKIVLVQETARDTQAGFLMYLPLYDNVASVERRAKGVIYAAFRMQDLINGIIGEDFERLVLSIYDGEEQTAANLMFTNDPDPDNPLSYRQLRTINVGGHNWLLQVGSRTDFVSEQEYVQSLLMLFLVAIFLLLLLYFLLNNAKARHQESLFATEILSNEKRFRLVIEASPCALIMTDTRGLITLVNAHTEQLFGYARDELLGRSVNVLLPDVLQQQHEEHMRGYLANPIAKKMSLRDELFGRSKDGRRVPIEVGLTPVHFANGISVLATINDVSERRRIEEQKTKHTRELERINKELDSFAYIASHDLKSPLRGIEQLAEWLNEDLADNASENARKYLKLIKSRIQRMAMLLDGLLAFSRIGRIEAELNQVNCADLISETFNLVAPPEGFSLTLEGMVPNFITARVPLEMVFRNLFANAIKHHDLPQGHINVTWALDGEMIRFCVTDDGPGIQPQYHDKVFAIFQTLKPRDEVEGSGLGLSLVKKAVEHYGGRVWVESEGRGTSFFFTWPLVIKEAE
ncbi:CHASE domain-containing sensor histidine kinase [Shewanella cyperi]|nr:CHASE domain-containing protein [Shewanella cyperi]